MITAKQSEIERIFRYTWNVYRNKLGYVIAFSIPMLFAWIILATVQAPTYSAMGAPHLRTGSIPDLTLSDILIIVVAYLGALIIIAETIVNINLLIKSKRMMTNLSSEILTGLGTYAISITLFFIIMFLLIFAFQLMTFDRPLQRFLFPLACFVSSYFLFFVPPAIVIDKEETLSAIRRSVDMAIRKPKLIFSWIIFGTVIMTIFGWIFLDSHIFPNTLSQFLYIAFHIIFLSPFLIILQTQMYMEKYPLAK